MTRPTVGAFMSRTPHTIGRSLMLSAAHEIMRAYHIRHLPVLDEGRLVGLVSLGDLHLIETLRDVRPDRVPVEEAMAEEPFTATPDTPLVQVVREMARRKLGGVPILDGGELVGMFTAIDALDALAGLLEPHVVNRPPPPPSRPRERRPQHRQ